MLRDELQSISLPLVGRLDPIRVQQHVRAAGWQHKPLAGDGQVALYQRPESKREQLLIPLSHELGDFAPRMAEVVFYLARYEKRPPADLLADLLLPDSDLLRFQESSPAAAAGDVPLEHGVSLLSGVRKTLLAAACSVVRPARFHPRMSLNEADQFLQRCRLGQTERSSFVLTVACPLDAVPREPGLFDPPFTRQVTSLLMRALQRLAGALDLGDDEAVLREEDREPVLSANLCEGLLDMQPEGDDASLRIRADYSPTIAPPSTGPAPSSVRFRRELFPRIEYLVGKLRPVQTPQRQFHLGFVETLNGRANSDNRMEGQVTLRLVAADSDSVRARTELSVEDYARADQAHMSNRPVSLEGILRRVGRSYRIDDPTRFQLLSPNPTSETPS